MKKRLFMIFGLVLLMAGGFAAAAMITVNADRDVSVDIANDKNGAIKIEAVHDESEILQTNKNGIVSFNLNNAFENAAGLNADAMFSIGTSEKPLFKITNNLKTDSVKISFTNDDNSTDIIKLRNADNEKIETQIEPGDFALFYFVVDSPANASEKVQLTGKLTIR